MMLISPDAPLWIAARMFLLEKGDDFFSQWDKVEKTFEHEDIHDLRVASRRLREGLALFAPCFPAKSLSRISTRAKRLTGLLGAIRNTDEALAFFSCQRDNSTQAVGELLEKPLASLREERKSELKRLRKGITSLEPKAFRKFFLETCNSPLIFIKSPIDPFTTVGLFARKMIDVRLGPVAELLPEAVREENINAQHRLRIAVKRLRYRYELVAPIAHGTYQELHESIKKYQEILGTMHDLDVFANLAIERIAGEDALEMVLVDIMQKRKQAFSVFMEMQNAIPFEQLGKRLKESL